MDAGSSLAKLLPKDASTDQKPYHAKRPHRKSRNGCQSCKHRKVKCSEERPTCRSCHLRKDKCVYLKGRQFANRPSSADSSLLPRTPPASQETSPAGTPTSDDDPLDFEATQPMIISEPQVLPPGRDMIELQLLWFYTQQTCSCFMVSERMHVLDRIYRTIFVQYAFELPCLMDCLLGLTSMHMEILNQPIDPRRTLFYQARALARYRQAIEEAKPETFPGLIACSLLFVAFSTSMFRTGTPGEGRFKAGDWMVLWRGIEVVVSVTSARALLEAEIAPAFYRPRLNLKKAAWSAPHYLSRMLALIPPDDPDSECSAVYHNTLRYLGTIYQELEAGISTMVYVRIMSWATFVPSKFTDLVREERPRALVLLAHFFAFCKFLDPHWWMVGVGTYGILEINTRIPPDLAEYMEIPLAAAKLCMDSTSLGRIILQDPTWTPGIRNQEDARVAQLGWVDDEGRPITPAEAMLDLPGQVEYTPRWNIQDVTANSGVMEAVPSGDGLMTE